MALSSGQQFEKLILGTIENYYNAQSRTGDMMKKTFGPSSMYSDGRCARRWYLAFNGGEWLDDATPRSRRIMEHGTQRHEALQKALGGIAHEIEREVTYESPPIRGYIDIVIEYEGQLIPGEIKTAMSMGYEKRAREHAVPAYQLGQLLLYMHILGSDRGFFLLENNDTKDIEIILIKMTPERREWVDYALDWYRQVYDAYEKDLLPSHHYRKNAKICKSCPVREACKSLPPQGDIDIPELELPE